MAWYLRPVGIRYASDYFRGRPHRQLVAEPKLRGLCKLNSDDHRQRQSHDPKVPDERFDELRDGATEIVRPTLPAVAAPSTGNASIWALQLDSAPRIDRQWAYDGIHLCPPWARQDLGPVMFRQTPVGPRRRVPYQGQQATRVAARAH